MLYFLLNSIILFPFSIGLIFGFVFNLTETETLSIAVFTIMISLALFMISAIYYLIKKERISIDI
jgi:hypothetical protein